MFRHETVRIARKTNAGTFFEDTSVRGEQINIRNEHGPTPRDSTLSLQGSLRLSNAMISTCYFMHQFVLPVGWFPLIPKFYQENGQGECFKWAVDAASLFLFANRNGDHQMLLQARTLYSSALTATNTAISDPSERLKDETFCAILILNIIDVSMSEKEA